MRLHVWCGASRTTLLDCVGSPRRVEENCQASAPSCSLALALALAFGLPIVSLVGAKDTRAELGVAHAAIPVHIYEQSIFTAAGIVAVDLGCARQQVAHEYRVVTFDDQPAPHVT